MSDYQLAKKSLQEEKKAVKDYALRNKKSKDTQLKKAFTHAKGEEKEHAKLFSKSMRNTKHYSHEAISSAQKQRGGK